MKRMWVLVAAVVCALGFVWFAQAASAGGSARGKDRVLSKVTFIHYRRGHARPPWAGGGGGKKKDKGLYAYIAKGARWREVEPFVLNPTCDDDLDDSKVKDAVSAGMLEWESAGGNATLEIYGELSLDHTADYNGGDRDRVNTISFGHYDDPNVIGVTTVWGYFSGPPSQRKIIEADILLNDDFEWGDATVDPALMDVQNIVTHELGHVAGMGDLYQADASEETMYGYSDEGETKKRDLYYGDIAGVTKLYK